MLDTTAATADDEEEQDPPGADSEEARAAFAKSLPKYPPAEDMLKHIMSGHIPFRSWCRHCVWGQAVDDPHSQSHTLCTNPIVAMDYCFLSREGELILAIVLVLVLAPHGAVGACQVQRKGPDEYAVGCVLFYLQVWGVKGCTLKADNEPAVQALLCEVRRRRGDATALEQPAPYSHQSNGLVENTVRRVEGVIRSMVFALEE